MHVYNSLHVSCACLFSSTACMPPDLLLPVGSETVEPLKDLAGTKQQRDVVVS